MKLLVLALALLALAACLIAISGCTDPQRQQALVAAKVGCQVDGALVPLAQPSVALLGAGGAAAATIDAQLVHPAVVAACAQIGGIPSVMP